MLIKKFCVTFFLYKKITFHFCMNETLKKIIFFQTKAQVSSARGYAELWESDESGDEEELQDLLRDNVG